MTGNISVSFVPGIVVNAVVACAKGDVVVAASALDFIIAVPAIDGVGPVASIDRVVSGFAIEVIGGVIRLVRRTPAQRYMMSVTASMAMESSVKPCAKVSSLKSLTNDIKLSGSCSLLSRDIAIQRLGKFP